MRVAYVCLDPGVPVFGCKGCSIHVQEILRAMLACGWRPELFVARTGGTAPVDLKSIPVQLLNCRQTAKRSHPKNRPTSGHPQCELEQSQLERGQLEQIQREQGRRERAVMEANEQLAGALQAAGPWDAVYERHALFSDSAMAFADRHGIPGVLEVNAPLIAEQARHRSLVNIQQAQRHAKSAFAEASCLIAVSQPVADYLRSATDCDEKVHVVSNGVDVERFAPKLAIETREGASHVVRDNQALEGRDLKREPSERRVAQISAGYRVTSGPGADRFVVGFVGTLKPWHGVANLVTALFQLRKTVPQAQLLIVGDGPQREELEKQVAGYDLVEAVEFTGAARHDEIPAWLARMDVAVAPYPQLPDFYFSPLKIYEYFAAGRPVIASNLGGLDQVIQHGRTGWLVEPDNTTELVEALRHLAAHPELRVQLGREARNTASRHHGWREKLAQIATAAGLEPEGSRLPGNADLEEVC